MKTKKNGLHKNVALLLVIVMFFSMLSTSLSVANPMDVSLDVFPNPSYGGTATAKMGENISTAQYTSGETASVSAKPAEGYLFVRWRNSKDETVSTSADYAFVITSNMDLTAEFELPINTDYSGGTGTQSDPYLIDSVENLLNINNDPDAYFKQISHIDLSGYSDINSIGNSAALFTGTYDGNGKTIKNLTMHRPDAFDSALSESYYVGVFNIGLGGVVRDLKIEDASIKATGTAGILAGINQGEIINCHVEGSVSVTHNSQGAGLLVGENNNLVQNSSAKGHVTGKNGIGGLVGKNTNTFESKGHITACYADVDIDADNCGGGLVGNNESGEYSTYPYTGTIQRSALIEESFAKGEVNGGWTLGGLVGTNGGEVNNCYSTCEVSSPTDGEYLGGFVGFNGGHISRSYSKGLVNGVTNAGGFSGDNNEGTAIESCYYDMSKSGQLDSGKGEPKVTSEMIVQSTFVDWDFVSVWTLQSDSYPYFKWQNFNIPKIVEETGSLNAVINESPNGGTSVEESMDFDGSMSTTPAAVKIVIYAWDFGDGTSALGEEVSHQYDNAGIYTVKLTITDDTSQEASVEKVIAITPAAVSEENVIIEDPELKALLLLSTINSDGSAEISKAEAKAATAFITSDIILTQSASQSSSQNATKTYEIKSLVGLEAFENLKTIDLLKYSSEAPSVSLNVSTMLPIVGLDKLEKLNVVGDIGSLEGMEQLSTLKSLRIMGVDKTQSGEQDRELDLTPIYGIETLENLRLSHIIVKDWTGINALSHLSMIEAFAAQTESLEGFRNMKSIESMTLSLGKIESVEVLSGLSALKTLNLSNNLITDIEPLSNLSLTGLDLTMNPINNRTTSGCYHKSVKDFVVGDLAYEVWKVEKERDNDDRQAVGVISGSGTYIEPVINKSTIEPVILDLKGSRIPEGSKFEISENLVTKSGDTITVDLSKMDLFSEVEVLLSSDGKDNTLKGQLSNGLKTKNRVTLNIPTVQDAKNIEVMLPDLENVFKQVDKINIESNLVSFEISKDSIEEDGNDNIKLSATKVDKDALPLNLRDRLPNGVESVFDLNAFVKDSQISNFNKPIEVSVPYTIKMGEDPEKISVYLLNDDGNIEKVAGSYNAETGKVKFKRSHFSKYFVMISMDTFMDIQNSWAQHSIEVLTGKGIISGKSSTIYDLNGLSTRAEFSNVISKLLLLKSDVDKHPFEDVEATLWYAEGINAMYQAGLIKGISETAFNPNASITREEAATLLANSLNYLGYNQIAFNQSNLFLDEHQISTWAEESVAQVYAYKLMNGYPNSEFKPKSNLNRSEMAQIIYNLYRLINQ